MFNYNRLRVEIIKGLLILLFVYTATSKLMDYHRFSFTLSQSPLITNAAGLLAVVLPIAELITALLLFVPATTRSGLKASVGLISLFTIYIGFMLVTQKSFPCSCGGVLSSMTWVEHLFFNLFFVVIANVGLHLHKQDKNRKNINTVVFDKRFAQTGDAENLLTE